MRVTIYPAYSSVSRALSTILDAPEKTTALKIKRAVGHDETSWLYMRLNSHEYLKGCLCFSCQHVKFWTRPVWVRAADWMPTWHRWVRADIGDRNVRLTLKGGEHFVVVALVDMPTYAAELSSRGLYGRLMALYWYGESLGIKAASVETGIKPLSLDERRAAVTKYSLRSIHNECQ